MAVAVVCVTAEVTATAATFSSLHFVCNSSVHLSALCICVSVFFNCIKLIFRFQSSKLSVLRISNVFVCFSTHLFGSKDNIISKSIYTNKHASYTRIRSHWPRAIMQLNECVVAIFDFKSVHIATCVMLN